MPALMLRRATPVRGGDLALVRVLEASIETLKAENEILREVSSRFVTFCTVLWTDHERPWRHAASSMVLRGRKPSLRMLIALQR